MLTYASLLENLKACLLECFICNNFVAKKVKKLNFKIQSTFGYAELALK